MYLLRNYVITATLYCLRRQNFLDFSFFNATIEFCIILTPGGVLGGSGKAEPPREKLFFNPTPDYPDSYVFLKNLNKIKIKPTRTCARGGKKKD